MSTKHHERRFGAFWPIVAATLLAACATAPAPQTTWERIAGPADATILERDTVICEGAAVNAAARVPAPSATGPTNIAFTASTWSGEQISGTAVARPGGSFASGLAAGTQARRERDTRTATMKACMAERGWLQRVR